MSEPVTSLLDDVLADCPGCPRPLALYALQRSVHEFYRRSRVRRYTTPAYTVQGVSAGLVIPTSANGMLPTTGHQLLEVMAAWWMLKPLRLMSIQEAEEEVGPDWRTQVGEPRAMVQESLDSAQLIPHLTTDAANSLIMSITHGPKEGVTDVDDDIYNRFKLELAAGAKGYLMLMKDKPWTDATMGAVWRDVFGDCVSGVALRSVFGPSGAPRQTKAHFS